MRRDAGRIIKVACVLILLAVPGAGMAQELEPEVYGGAIIMEDSTPTEDSTWIFPEVKAKNLEGREFAMPGDFEGRANIVIVAFSREQHRLVETWFPVTDALEETYPELRTYELPTIKKMNWLVRSFITGGMRSGLSSREARERSIVLFVDKEPFRAALGIPDEETIHLFLIDSDGRVLFRTEGPRSVERETDLRSAVAVVFGDEK